MEPVHGGIDEVEVHGLFLMVSQVIVLHAPIPCEAIPDGMFGMEAFVEVVDGQGVETGLCDEDSEHPRTGYQINRDPRDNYTVQIVVLEHTPPRVLIDLCFQSRRGVIPMVEAMPPKERTRPRIMRHLMQRVLEGRHE